MNILQAIGDRNLFAPWFKSRTWTAWFSFLSALFALPMTDDQLVIYRKCTGRKNSPKLPATEAWLVVGRRGGKSFIIALVAVFLACFKDYSNYLSPGEKGIVVVLAADRKQARVVFRYVTALLRNIPMLTNMITRDTVESIELSNNIIIEVHVSSFRSVRGYTVIAALLDEVAFWRSEDSASPDVEVVNALKPAMATIPSAILIGFSSPYRRQGVLFEAHRDHYGQEDDSILVWQAETKIMNPTIPQYIIDKAYERDPIRAVAEYGAQFRSDIAGFLLDEWITSSVVPGRHELEPVPDNVYRAFCDPSGGSRDAFTLSIAHNDNGIVVIDVCRGRKPPFSPAAVVAEYAEILKRYNLYEVTGDRYAAEWVVNAFQKEGIVYRRAEHNKSGDGKPVGISKSEIYLEVEAAFATGKVELLDLKTLQTELRQLERRTMSGGRDRVDHPPNGFDDNANSACGALWLVSKEKVEITIDDFLVGEPLAVVEAFGRPDEESDESWRLTDDDFYDV